MKVRVALTAFLTSAALMIGADASSEVTFVGHEKVADALVKGGVLAAASDLQVQGSHKVASEIPESHEKRTHIWYVLSGTATLVTGGTIVNAKMIRPGEVRGSDLQGGQPHRLSKGDLIIVPAGTPHWWKEVPNSGINLYAVDIRKPGFVESSDKLKPVR
jgi:quercetin dioxygenase-like cupin family protein